MVIVPSMCIKVVIVVVGGIIGAIIGGIIGAICRLILAVVKDGKPLIVFLIIFSSFYVLFLAII
mgnify:CR=1 FL=1